MTTSTGSEALDRMVERLGSTADPKRRYEYVLWLAKKLEPMPAEQQTEAIKVKGCVSQVFVQGRLDQGLMRWQGDSDALITKGLLALLIHGLDGLTPEQVQSMDPAFIHWTSGQPHAFSSQWLSEHPAHDAATGQRSGQLSDTDQYIESSLNVPTQNTGNGNKDRSWPVGLGHRGWRGGFDPAESPGTSPPGEGSGAGESCRTRPQPSEAG